MTAAAEQTATDSAHALIQHAVDEAARLLRADGAMAYLVDEADPTTLRFAAEAGIRSREVSALIRDLELPIGVGLFGTAAQRRELFVTGDYRNDDRFEHSEVADKIVRVARMRSFAAAPLIAGGEVLGGLGAYSSRVDDFDEGELALLQALADHTAAAIHNTRLNAQLSESERRYRFLTEIAAAISSLRDPAAVLTRTVEEAAHLLEAETVIIQQLRPGTDELEDFRSVDAPSRGALSGVIVRIGDGVSGRAVERGEVVSTGNYLEDRSFRHTDAADGWIRSRGFRSAIAAPLIGTEGAIGAISAYSPRPDAFGQPQTELLGALAAQAAVAVTNARLYREVKQSAEERGRRVEAQRTLAEIARQLTAIREASTVLQRTVDEAVRLLGADGGRIDLVEEGSGVLAYAYGHSQIDRPIDRSAQGDLVRADEGISGRAVIEGRPVFTGDYLNDPSFVHAPGPDGYVREHGIVSVMAAPLFGEEGALGTLTVHSKHRDAFGPEDAELLGALASHAAIAVSNATLYERLGSRVAAQRALASIAAEIAALRDPSAVVQRAVEEAMRLLGGEAAMVNPLEPGGEMLGMPLAYAPADHPYDDVPVPVGVGVSGRAIAEDRVIRTGDYLADPRFDHTPELDGYITRRGIVSVITAPLRGTSGRIGALTVQSNRRDAFDDDDAEVLGLLADHAAIAISNARLYEELRDRADAQRSLAELAGQIAALHDPTDVVQRSVVHAARLLRADRAQVNLLAESGDHLERPIASAPSPPSPTDVIVPLGSGIAGLAAQEHRVRWTGDYLSDDSFPHDVGDARIREQAIHSMMSAPLIGPDGLLGTITVQSSRIGAFDADDAELLKLLADQAAITITNARLYEQLTASEERYRFLVDNSPDLIWSCDAEGRFIFLSESFERITGFAVDEALGKHFTEFTVAASLPTVDGAWAAMQQDPSSEQRIRIEVPHKDGSTVTVEIYAVPTNIDGRFAGAHGSVRDLTERERLERDLRRQAAELAAGQERAHLARELHDSVTQALFSMGLTARSLELLLETDLDAARAKLAELRELQRDALAEMRTLIFELRPRSLEQDGLVQAIKTHASAVQGRTGLAVTIDADLEERLPIETEEALYRISQEALHNVVKHAGASSARIRLRREGPGVCLSITDDGSGFDPQRVGRGHLGLVGMQQRADRIGAELRVDSGQGLGTTVEVRLPVERVAERQPAGLSAE